jgi:hypothetical protein
MFQIQSRTALVLLSLLIVAGCSGGGGGGEVPVAAADTSEWLISRDFVFDGGPGPDGIPALESPNFESASTILTVNPNDLAIAVQHNGEIKIYPHDIMDWHEIVNDGPDDDPLVLSYCPLTGSALAWLGTATDANATFGVSGLLYNSNLLLYDRESRSLWSQMYEASVNGPRIRELPPRVQLIEAKFGTLRDMYPDATVMTRNTGYIRDYPDYPYGDYKQSSDLLFPVSNADNRMHPKTRVIGLRSGSGVSPDTLTRVYQLGAFGPATQAINDQFGNQSIVVVGNTDLDFAVIYDRELADGTILTFAPVENDLPNILSDDEGNVWDAFGTAVSGPRAGTQLEMTKSYTAYWFAWVSHFSNAEIYFN